jgi:hypothetical protein
VRLVVCCWLVILPFALARPGTARDIHVDNRMGEDGATGHNPQIAPNRTGPVRTIAKALQLAETGDRILLARTGVPYRESISLVGSKHSGVASQPFALVGNDAVLDGSAPVPRRAWEHYRGAVFRFRPPGQHYQQFFLSDRPLPRVIGESGSREPPKLQPLDWCLCGGYIYFRADYGRLPEDYALSYAQETTGITLFHVDSVMIVDLTVQGFQIDGVSVFNSARNVTLAGLTVRGNGRAGMVSGGASDVAIVGCVVGNNGESQVLTLPLSETHVTQSELLSNTAPAWVDRGGRMFIDGKEVKGGLDAPLPSWEKFQAAGVGVAVGRRYTPGDAKR